MNQMTNTTMNPFRFTTMQGRSASSNFMAANVQDNGNGGGQIGVDEVVFDSKSGTFATFQDSPSLTSLLNNSRDVACSFIM